MPTPRAPRVLYLVGDETGSAMWRAWSICRHLQGLGMVAEWEHKDNTDNVLPLIAAGMFDIIVTPRIVWPKEHIGDLWVGAIHRAGLAWIYECDDDVFSPQIVHRQQRVFERERAVGEQALEWQRQERIRLMYAADGVIVASERLRSIVTHHMSGAPRVPPIECVPNAIDVALFRRTLRGIGRLPELEGKTTIGWAGGTREDSDLAPLVGAWPALARRHPDLHFVVQGHVPTVLANAMPPERFHTLPWLPLEEYPRGLVNVDIGCCTVAPTVFNSAKTPIKWWEFTLAGAACVVSPTLYGRDVEHGVDALVADTDDDWQAALERLVVDAQLRRDINKAARRSVVTRHSLENNWWRWPQAWTRILLDFHERRARRLVRA